eukprot:scaffold74265_cov97-Phaeocystis_antarctica.AAC.1
MACVRPSIVPFLYSKRAAATRSLVSPLWAIDRFVAVTSTPAVEPPSTMLMMQHASHTKSFMREIYEGDGTSPLVREAKVHRQAVGGRSGSRTARARVGAGQHGGEGDGGAEDSGDREDSAVHRRHLGHEEHRLEHVDEGLHGVPAPRKG